MENTSKDKTLIITRVFDAPRELVWKMWTDPEMLKKWWGPKIFTCPVSNIDLRVGGKYLHCMRDGDGKDYWGTGVYREIIPMEKIVATDSFADKDGNVVSPTEYGASPDFPREMEVTITFEEHDGKTTMTLIHSSIDKIDATMLGLMKQGWNESFDKMSERFKHY